MSEKKRKLKIHWLVGQEEKDAFLHCDPESVLLASDQPTPPGSTQTTHTLTISVSLWEMDFFESVWEQRTAWAGKSDIPSPSSRIDWTVVNFRVAVVDEKNDKNFTIEVYLRDQGVVPFSMETSGNQLTQLLFSKKSNRKN
jgi:hypothetical protein